MTRCKMLLGANKYGEIVFGEWEVCTLNGYPEFSASFDTVRPVCEDSVNLVDYFEDCSDPRCMDADWIIDQCNYHRCCPDDLPQALADDCYDLRDALDCSLFPEKYTINGKNWYFESSSCGQHDTREEMTLYVNKAAYDDLISLWENFHLKKVDEKEIASVLASVKNRLTVNEEEWITKFIVDNIINENTDCEVL